MVQKAKKRKASEKKAELCLMHVQLSHHGSEIIYCEIVYLQELCKAYVSHEIINDT